MSEKKALIIGAGPAGLTAAYELLAKTDIKPVIYELTDKTGGISKTVNYKGNRIDIGGHRFFSKSDRVMEWWLNIMPLQGSPAIDDEILGRNVPISTVSTEKKLGSTREHLNATDPEQYDEVMLNRNRLSRIFFLRKFFDYPVSLNYNTFKNLGIIRTTKIGLSYLKSSLRPIKDEKSLEDFFINRFGVELYKTFFKDYTEKVWGTPCRDIGADWGYQRIKGLSIKKTVFNAINPQGKHDKSISQKNIETSLIGNFLYPKFGPGQMWEKVAKIVEETGGQIFYKKKVIGINIEGKFVSELIIRDERTGEIEIHNGEYVFSTMPVKDLINAFNSKLPNNVAEIAEGLIYRDFITVGLLLEKLKINNETKNPTLNNIVPDNWIYIQERDIKIGRLQIFNNWSPYMVNDSDKVWIGLEYFCNEGDDLWNMNDNDFIDFAITELSKINIIDPDDVLDSTLIREPKTYPAYFGTYKNFNFIRDFTDKFENLFLIGRNGMHRYNNMDHSMLTAMTAVDNIINDVTSKDNLWKINAEKTYNE
jgi:protoporphyrinogen oxidase